MNDGLKVGVSRAPTRFGTVSYTIQSWVSRGYIEAEIDPPKRKKPGAILIRLRHPEEKRMKSVTVNGEPWKDFDPQKELVRIAQADGHEGALRIRAEY